MKLATFQTPGGRTRAGEVRGEPGDVVRIEIEGPGEIEHAIAG